MTPREHVVSVLREDGPMTADDVTSLITRRTELATRAAVLQLIKAGRLRLLPEGKLEPVKITGGE